MNAGRNLSGDGVWGNFSHSRRAGSKLFSAYAELGPAVAIATSYVSGLSNDN